MRCAQIRHGLDAEQLRRGRKRKSESGLRDWTEAEDVQLLKVVWSGARGLDRSIPTRGYETCKKRLQLIGKHVDPQWLVLHKSDAMLRANVIAVLEDESFHAQVDAVVCPVPRERANKSRQVNLKKRRRAREVFSGSCCPLFWKEQLAA